MKCYIGTKIITAEPQQHEDGRDGYRVVYPDGYASWSPKETFEQAYREVSEGERDLLENPDLRAAVARSS
jgi:hypothetical protein